MSDNSSTPDAKAHLKLIYCHAKTEWTLDELAASLPTTPEGAIIMRCERSPPYLWVVPKRRPTEQPASE